MPLVVAKFISAWGGGSLITNFVKHKHKKEKVQECLNQVADLDLFENIGWSRLLDLWS